MPLNRFHWRLLAVCGVGWMFNAMDVILVSFLIAPIGVELGLDAAPATGLITQTALVVSAGFIGMLIGAAVSGRLADRYGRKAVFQWTILVFAVGSALCALAPTYEVLLVARVIAGLGLGGGLPVVATLVSELSPRASRGRMIVLLQSFWAYGTVAAGLIAVSVVPQFGWRGAFLVGALPALYVLYLRRVLPESPRYLASRGRAVEADAVVSRVERAGGASLRLGRVVAPPAPERRARIGDLWGPGLRKRTLMLWLVWSGIVFTYHVIFVWVPTLLGARGPSEVHGIELFFVAAIAQLPGYFSAAWLVERWGRKPTLATYIAGTAVAAFLFGNAGTGTGAFVYASLLSFFALGAWGVVYVYSAELYPTAIRATGAGAASSFGTIGGIVGLLMPPALAGAVGQPGAFTLFMAVLVVTGLVVLVLAEETKGRSLEEIAS